MRIHICGIYGCGKSTLAKLLSDILKIDYYSLDDIKYLIKYSKIRSVDERIKLVNEICDKKKLITEVYRYNKSHQPVSLLEHKRLIQKHNKRVIIVKDNLDISRVISKFRN